MNLVSYEYVASKTPRPPAHVIEIAEARSRRRLPRGGPRRTLLMPLVTAIMAFAVLVVPAGALAAGPVDHFDIHVPTNLRINSPFLVTAYARDAAGNLVTGYTATTTWTDSAGATGTTPVGFSNGVGELYLQFFTPVHADRWIVANADAPSTGAPFNVLGPATHLGLTMPSSVAAGSTVKITARALDAAGNTATDYSGSGVWSDSWGTLSPIAPVDFVAGVSTTWAQPSIAHQDVLTFKSGGMSVQRTFNAFGPADHLAAGVPSTANAGVAFALTVTAYDRFGSIVTNYAPSSPGSVAIGTGGVPFSELAPFANGVSKTKITSGPAHQSRFAPSVGGLVALSNPINVIGPPDHVATTFKRTDGLSGCSSVTGTVGLKMYDSADNLLTGYNGQLLMNLYSAITGAAPGVTAPFVKGVSTTTNVSVNFGSQTPDSNSITLNDPATYREMGKVMICS
jgi:hypothetical protein